MRSLLRKCLYKFIIINIIMIWDLHRFSFIHILSDIYCLKNSVLKPSEFGLITGSGS